MSVELHIFLHGSQVPERDAWQDAIQQCGFPVTLDAAFPVRTHTGFLPAAYGTRQSGFEFSLDPAADLLSSHPHIAARVGDRDACASFRWGGDLTEMAAAVCSASALAHLTDGLYYYPDDDLLYTADEALSVTREDLKHVPPVA